MSAQGFGPRGRAGHSILHVEVLHITLVGFGEALSHALGQEVVAAARMETRNIVKKSAKRESVAKRQI